MEEALYKELLEKAYSELPEVLYKKERFELPQVKGKLIRSRTVISNFKDIGKYLSRDSAHFSRFVLKDLGVRGELDERGELILHSRFQPGILNRAVSRYFKSYVECSHCNSPDTELSQDFSEKKCKACGFTEKVNKI